MLPLFSWLLVSSVSQQHCSRPQLSHSCWLHILCSSILNTVLVIFTFFIFKPFGFRVFFFLNISLIKLNIIWTSLEVELTLFTAGVIFPYQLFFFFINNYYSCWILPRHKTFSSRVKKLSSCMTPPSCMPHELLLCQLKKKLA